MIEIESRDTLTRQAIQLHKAVSKKLAHAVALSSGHPPVLGMELAQTGWGNSHLLQK